MSYLTQRIGA